MTNHHQVAYSKTKNFNKEYCSSREVAKKHLTESATCFFVFFTGCVAGSNRVCVYSKENAENECLLVWTSYTFHRRDDRTNTTIFHTLLYTLLLASFEVSNFVIEEMIIFLFINIRPKGY